MMIGFTYKSTKQALTNHRHLYLFPSATSASFKSVCERIHKMDAHKPVAEIFVEGELSPFEHKAMHNLTKHFRLEQPLVECSLQEYDRQIGS
jgi:hypothetical protein